MLVGRCAHLAEVSEPRASSGGSRALFAGLPWPLTLRVSPGLFVVGSLARVPRGGSTRRRAPVPARRCSRTYHGRPTRSGTHGGTWSSGAWGGPLGTHRLDRRPRRVLAPRRRRATRGATRGSPCTTLGHAVRRRSASPAALPRARRAGRGGVARRRALRSWHPSSWFPLRGAVPPGLALAFTSVPSPNTRVVASTWLHAHAPRIVSLEPGEALPRTRRRPRPGALRPRRPGPTIDTRGARSPGRARPPTTSCCRATVLPASPHWPCDSR
jgi:hypothetical protein